jgi:hypothetical protein
MHRSLGHVPSPSSSSHGKLGWRPRFGEAFLRKATRRHRAQPGPGHDRGRRAGPQ